MFTTFHYKEDPNTKDFAACYPFHHEQMLMPIIDIVDDEFTCYCTGINIHLDELAQEGDKDGHRILSSQLHMLMSAQGIITMGNNRTFSTTVGNSRRGNVNANNIAPDGILQDGEDERFRPFEDNSV